MDKKVLLISDEEYSIKNNGGAECNNHEIIKLLNSSGIKCDFLTTHEFNNKAGFINDYNLYIVSNFYFISESAKTFLYGKKYIITEHDYKFVRERNPCFYPNLTVPPEKVVHLDFYRNAKFVLVQSNFQKEVFGRSVKLDNIINFSGNLWADDTLDLILSLSKTPKNGKAAILGEDDYGIKGRDISIEFCKKVHLKYELLPKTDHHSFLKNLSKYSTYVLFPRSPETLSRVSIEARLMGLSVITSDYTAAVHESFFDYESNKMIEYIKDKPKQILKLITDLL